MAMHKWMWSLTAVALLGLAPGCSERNTENQTNRQGVGAVERGNEGDETPVDNQSVTEGRPDITGGEDPADQEFHGTVTGVAANSVTVRDKGGTTMTLSFDEDTRFIRQGQAAERAQLQEGMQVRAAYDEDEGKYEATTVELLQGSSPKTQGQ